MKQDVRERVVLLSTLVPSLSVTNVWDLPLWAWVQYRDYHDAYVEAKRKEARANG